jgi:hypothetical protein
LGCYTFSKPGKVALPNGVITPTALPSFAILYIAEFIWGLIFFFFKRLIKKLPSVTVFLASLKDNVSLFLFAGIDIDLSDKSTCI